MAVDKITSPPSKIDIQKKINEIIDNLGSGGGTSSGIIVKKVTEDEYKDLAIKDANTLYIITTGFLVWGTSLWSNALWSLGDE